MSRFSVTKVAFVPWLMKGSQLMVKASNVWLIALVYFQDFYNLMNVYLDAVFFPRAVRDPQVSVEHAIKFLNKTCSRHGYSCLLFAVYSDWVCESRLIWIMYAVTALRVDVKKYGALRNTSISVTSCKCPIWYILWRIQCIMMPFCMIPCCYQAFLDTRIESFMFNVGYAAGGLALRAGRQGPATDVQGCGFQRDERRLFFPRLASQSHLPAGEPHNGDCL